jgi:hypothetical protein
MGTHKLSAWDADTIGTGRAEHLTPIVINNRDNEFHVTATRGKIEGRVWKKGSNLVDH